MTTREPYLESLHGESVIPLPQDEARIGRMADNDVHLNDPQVSRHHARIIRRGSSLTVEDLGSANGTRVNGRMVTGETLIRDGDRLGFGPLSFVLHVPAAETTATGRTPAAVPKVRAEEGAGPFGAPLGPAPAFPAGPVMPLEPVPDVAFPAAPEFPPGLPPLGHK